MKSLHLFQHISGALEAPTEIQKRALEAILFFDKKVWMTLFGWELGEIFRRILLELGDAGVATEGDLLSLIVDRHGRPHLADFLAGNGTGRGVGHDSGDERQKQRKNHALHDFIT